MKIDPKFSSQQMDLPKFTHQPALRLGDDEARALWSNIVHPAAAAGAEFLGAHGGATVPLPAWTTPLFGPAPLLADNPIPPASETPAVIPAQLLLDRLEQPDASGARDYHALMAPLVEMLPTTRQPRLQTSLRWLEEAQASGDLSGVAKQLTNLSYHFGLPDIPELTDFMAAVVERDSGLADTPLIEIPRQDGRLREFAQLRRDVLVAQAGGATSATGTKLGSLLDRLLASEGQYRLNLRAEAAVMQLLSRQFDTMGGDIERFSHHVAGLVEPASAKQRETQREFFQALDQIERLPPGAGWAQLAAGKPAPVGFSLGVLSTMAPTSEDVLAGIRGLVSDPQRAVGEALRTTVDGMKGLGQLPQAIQTLYRQVRDGDAFATGQLAGLAVSTLSSAAAAGVSAHRLQGAVRGLNRTGRSMPQMAQVSLNDRANRWQTVGRASAVTPPPTAVKPPPTLPGAKPAAPVRAAAPANTIVTAAGMATPTPLGAQVRGAMAATGCTRAWRHT